MCGKKRPENEFHFKNKARGLRHGQCSECSRAQVKNHYKKNRPYYLLKAKTRNKNLRLTARNYIREYLSRNTCIDCGESDPIVLEFDHREDKFKEISNLIKGTYPLEIIKKEVGKCDIRCANCHRKKTAKEFGWSRNKDGNAPVA